MAHLNYYNHMANVTEIFYDSHRELIEKICIDLGAPDKIEDLVARYLDEKMKLKPKKDPNHPKRPKTSYMFFCDEKRPLVKKKWPDMETAQVFKKLGALWQKEKSKTRFEKMSEVDKVRYEEDMETYNNNLHMQELMAYSKPSTSTSAVPVADIATSSS